MLIGVALVADGFKFHIPRGYIYFAIAFSAAVEAFNMLARRNRKKPLANVARKDRFPLPRSALQATTCALSLS